MLEGLTSKKLWPLAVNEAGLSPILSIQEFGSTNSMIIVTSRVCCPLPIIHGQLTGSGKLLIIDFACSIN